jgi:hypothetical protein
MELILEFWFFHFMFMLYMLWHVLIYFCLCCSCVELSFMQVLLWYVFGEYAFAFVSSAGNRIHRMLKLGLSIDEDATENDADMPPLEEADADAEGSKMEEVD